jgi:membrane-bound lytic murein transglycosylase B
MAATNDVQINKPAEQQFINKMVNKYHFSHRFVSDLIYNAHFLPEVIQNMRNPYEEKPWYMYRKLFLTAKRIQQGVKYWRNHTKDLAKANEMYGVPESIIVGIVGVESFYGESTGTYSILDALTTLSFAYPKRARFFQSELAQYLLLTQSLNFNPKALYGSYAGAMGLPQFMPSSYRYYAVDFNNNGQKDLLKDTGDVIGSVANYLFQAGWHRGKLVAVPAKVTGDKYKKILNDKLKPMFTVAKIRKYGVEPTAKLSPQTKVNLIRLKTKEGCEYWLGLHNLYVITRYNTNTQYAMAVYQLALAIKKTENGTYNKEYINLHFGVSS